MRIKLVRDKTTRFFICLMLCFLLILVSACTSEGEKVVEREVLVTQLVEVTREVPVDVIQEVEVTREVPVEVVREIEVTREVPVEVVREIEVTREVPVEVTRLVVDAAAGEEQVTEEVEPTIITVSEQTNQPSSVATTISVGGQTDSSANSCWRWEEASQHLGENGCVEAVVSGVGESANAFFINFSPERDSFYAISFDWAWEELTGECLRLSGTISEYQGRSQLIIENPASQVHYCGNDQDGPPAFER